MQEEAGDCRQELNGNVDYRVCEGYLPPVFEDSDNDGMTDNFMITARVTWRQTALMAMVSGRALYGQ